VARLASDFHQAAQYLRAAGTRLQFFILPKEGALLAKGLAAAVKQRYREMATPLGPVSALVARRGKRAGKISGRPAKQPVVPAPLFTIIAHSIMLAQRRRLAWRVSVDPTAIYPQATLRFPRGVPLGFLAWVHEGRRGAIVPMTNLMGTYLRGLREGWAGYRKRVTPGKKGHGPTGVSGGRTRMGGKKIALFPPERPVWSYVINTGITPLLVRAVRNISIELIKLAQRHGGMPVSISGSITHTLP